MNQKTILDNIFSIRVASDSCQMKAAESVAEPSSTMHAAPNAGASCLGCARGVVMLSIMTPTPTALDLQGFQLRVRHGASPISLVDF